jgi:hypothetical protein
MSQPRGSIWNLREISRQNSGACYSTGNYEVELLLIGGGGSGNNWGASGTTNGGGGAGGVIYSSGLVVQRGCSYPIIIGAGGRSSGNIEGSPGQNSCFCYTTGGPPSGVNFIACGGGRAGGGGHPIQEVARTGGSGGGGSGIGVIPGSSQPADVGGGGYGETSNVACFFGTPGAPGVCHYGARGLQACPGCAPVFFGAFPGVSGFGGNGGKACVTPTPTNFGGGGGGAGGDGCPGTPAKNGNGGLGLTFSISGSSLGYAGGGGGGGGCVPAPGCPTRGIGVCGGASTGTPTEPGHGCANRGGGASGGTNPSDSPTQPLGGSGVAIIRYRGNQIGTGGSLVTCLSPIVCTSHVFTGSGCFTA